jgi:hypothetical protein
MKNTRASPLKDALLAGLPLAVVLGPVLLIAGVPAVLVIQGMAVAFGVGAATELLTARATWAKATGGALVVAVALFIARSWGGWSERLLGGEEAQSASVPAPRSLGVPPASGAALPEYTGATGAGGGGVVRAPSRAVDQGRGAPFPPAPAESRQPRSVMVQPETSPQPGSADASRPPEARSPSAAVLVVRNESSDTVHVWLRAPGSDEPARVLGPGQDAELAISPGDVDRTRIAWQRGSVTRSISWAAAAAGGAVFRISSD